MYQSYRELIEALQATPATLQGLVGGITQKQAQTARGGDENWSVVEVVCHLRDSEAMGLNRMQTLRDDPQPVISGFDQNALAIQNNYATTHLTAALDGFIRLRQQHTAELSALTPAQWERVGQHQRVGEMTIFNHTLHWVWHDAIHLAQIARQLTPNR